MSRSLTHCDCGARMDVNESRNRTIDGVQTVWRRRRCKPCGKRKKTIELPEDLARKILRLLAGAQIKEPTP